MNHMYIQFHHLFSLVVKHFLYVEEECRFLGLENKRKIESLEQRKLRPEMTV